MGFKQDVAKEMRRLVKVRYGLYTSTDNDGDVSIDADRLIADAVQNVAGGKSISGKQRDYFEMVASGMEYSLSVQTADTRRYTRNPYGYNGLNQRDYYQRER